MCIRVYIDVHVSCVEERPKLQQLQQMMKNHDEIVRHWWDLGNVLLDQDDTLMRKIKSHYHNDDETCCLEVFKHWLTWKKQSNTSWWQLIIALMDIKLLDTAKAVREQLKQGNLVTNIIYT